MKILHFAIENFARVPGNLVRAERALGHESYLMTLFPTSHKFHEEDHCLRMPFVATHSISFLKTFFRSQHTLSNTRKSPNLGPPVWEPKNRFMGQLFDLRDQLWKSRIFKKLRTINIESFDVLFLDGGLGFLRNGKIVTRLKENGLKIGVLYCGSDLRTRGVLPSIENLADVRFTVEYDHVLLDPTLRFLYFRNYR